MFSQQWATCTMTVVPLDDNGAEGYGAQEEFFIPLTEAVSVGLGSRLPFTHRTPA